MIILKEGLRMLQRARRVAKEGFRTYAGTPEEICSQIISDCFDHEKQYFRVSAGHFCEYYVRDFAFCCEALAQLGHAKEVRKTLAYALSRFEHKGRITTSINPEGKPFDYYLPSGPESIGLFLYSFTHTGNSDLAKRHAWFLQREVDRVVRMTNPKTLLPRGRYSTIRDHAQRPAACYDMVMLCVVAREAKALGLTFPYTEAQLKERLIKEYWNGSYFFQDARKQPIVISDANIFPFWTGIIADKKMLTSAVAAMQEAKLDDPFPIRYVSEAEKKEEKVDMHLAALLAPDYETSSIWMHLGLAYLRILPDRKLAKKHLNAYRALIEEHRTFLELYDNDGTPLRRRLYVSDEGMLWCANWLALRT